MKTLSKVLAVTMISVFLVAGSAMALPFNSRPVTGLNNLGALQDFFDSENQTIDVYNDQSGAAIWTTTASQNSQFTIMLEAAGWANTNKFGIYNYGDTTTLFEVFDGVSSVGWHAIVGFNSGGTPGKTVVTLLDNSDTIIDQTTYYGVNSSSFGFYLDARDRGATNAKLYFSEDDQNPDGTAQNLVYDGTGTNAGNWWIAFEDQARWLSADSDFTDFIITGESINPVPEPTTILLSGLGLLGMGAYLRRRRSKKA